MQKQPLSRKAIDVLAENGYKFQSTQNSASFRRSPGIMGGIVIMIITLFASIPVFAAGVLYGAGLIAAVLGAIIIRRIYFSDRSSFQLDREQKTFSAKVGTFHQEDKPLKMISTIVLHSQFIDEYVTAARNSVEEHLISIGIQLMNKEEITLFKLKSDQSEPTKEINELYHFLEESVKMAKAA